MNTRRPVHHRAKIAYELGHQIDLADQLITVDTHTHRKDPGHKIIFDILEWFTVIALAKLQAPGRVQKLYMDLKRPLQGRGCIGERAH